VTYLTPSETSNFPFKNFKISLPSQFTSIVYQFLNIFITDEFFGKKNSKIKRKKKLKSTNANSKWRLSMFHILY